MSIYQLYRQTVGLLGTLVLAGAVSGTVSAAPQAQPSIPTDPTLTIVTDNITQAIARDNVVTLTGRTALGPLGESVHLLYVVDVSQAGVVASAPGQDCNTDGTVTAQDNFNHDATEGDLLDCEISAVSALHQWLSARSVISNGVILYAGSALIADVDPAPELQPFTRLDADRNQNGQADLVEVLQSVSAEQVQSFTSSSVNNGVNLDSALWAIQQAFAPVVSGQKIAFLLATGDDELDTGPDSALAALTGAGVIVNPYAVGGARAGCQPGANLRLIADQTGGVCTVVATLSALPTTLAGAKPKGIAHVKVQVDQQEPQLASLDALGNWWLDIPKCTAGPMSTLATAQATDGAQASAAFVLCGPPVLPTEPEPPQPKSLQMTFFPLIATRNVLVTPGQ